MDENSKIRDKLDSTTQSVIVQSKLQVENDVNNEIYSQFTGSNVSSILLLLLF